MKYLCTNLLNSEEDDNLVDVVESVIFKEHMHYSHHDVFLKTLTYDPVSSASYHWQQSLSFLLILCTSRQSLKGHDKSIKITKYEVGSFNILTFKVKFLISYCKLFLLFKYSFNEDEFIMFCFM